MFDSRAIAAGCAAVLLSFAGGARAADCAGFTDVSTADSYCANVAWLKNRAVTTGCTASTYCPNDPVTRLAMAAFMNRLGKALSVDTLFNESLLGATTVGAIGSPSMVCVTGDTAASTYPRAASIEGIIAGLADGNSVAWRLGVYYSTDGGGSWNDAGSAMPGSSAANLWSEATAQTAMDLDPGQAYRFAVGIMRDDAVSGTTGNFATGRCQVSVGITNRNGDPAGVPFGG